MDEPTPLTFHGAAIVWDASQAISVAGPAISEEDVFDSWRSLPVLYESGQCVRRVFGELMLVGYAMGCVKFDD